MRNGNETKSFSSSSPFDCEVGLAMKMQLPPYSCEGGGGGVGSFSNGSTNHRHPHIYDLADATLLQRSLENSAASRAYGASAGGMMPMCGKALFTSSQLHELERQKMIHKYIMASILVPPQLLLSTSLFTLPMQHAWRCKRTDGKKWRCSRDVRPDQKYCERHAHKNRPRSRKHVEISPHNFSPKPSPTLPRSTAQFPYDQTRCIEWLMRGGNNNSNTNSEGSKQQVMYKNENSASVYHQHFADGSKIDTAYQTTSLFIDAISNKGEEKKWQSSALSLSMCEGGNEKGDVGMGMMMKNQWANPISWMNSGGPLGEALCLGNASAIRAAAAGGGSGCSNLASPPPSHGSHALNFIG